MDGAGVEPRLDKRAERKLQRARLIQTRAALVDREQREAALQQRVRDWLRQADVHALGFYFPTRGEPDLRPVIADWLAFDAARTAALPVMAAALLEFRRWTADAPMQAGGFGIPVPAQGHAVQPECLLIPCLGFDPQRFRLGYGGGYYDRTLAALAPRPIAIGIAFEASRIDTIDPQPHDVQLDAILTDATQY